MAYVTQRRNGLLFLGSFTWATRPSASLNPLAEIFITDIDDGVLLMSDGRVWRSASNSPITIVNNSIPMGLGSSGTMANNGAVTFTTAFPRILSGGAFLYYPNNAIFAGSSAGVYWTVMSSTTVGVVYNNAYTSGQPIIPISPTAFSSTGPGAFVQTTASTTILAPGTLLGGFLGVNGTFNAFITVSHNSSVTSKTITLRLGGVSVFFVGSTTLARLFYNTSIHNRGKEDLQFSHGSDLGYSGSSSSGSFVDTLIDTSANKDITLTASIVDALSYILLEECVISALPHG